MAYLGTQPNDVKKNIGLYTPSEILQLTKDGSWGGSLELIQEQTVSGVATVDFTNLKGNIYDAHYLTIENFKPVNDNVLLSIRFAESGTLETDSVYMVSCAEYYSNGSFSDFKSTGISRIRVIENTGNGTNEVGNAYIYLYNLNDSSKFSNLTFQTQGQGVDNLPIGAFGGGLLPQTSTVDQIQIGTYDVSSNFSLTAKLYGIKQL